MEEHKYLLGMLLHTPSSIKEDKSSITPLTFPRDEFGLPRVPPEFLQETVHIVTRDVDLKSVDFSFAEILFYPVRFGFGVFAYITSPQQIKKLARLTGLDNLEKIADSLSAKLKPSMALHAWKKSVYTLGENNTSYSMTPDPEMKIVTLWLATFFKKLCPEYKILHSKIANTLFLIRHEEFADLVSKATFETESIIRKTAKGKSRIIFVPHEMFMDFTFLVAGMKSKDATLLKDLALRINREILTIGHVPAQIQCVEELMTVKPSDLPQLELLSFDKED